MLRTSLKLVRNTLALMLLVVVTAFAQGPGGQRPQGPPTPAMELQHLVKVMTDASVPLSDTQQTAVLSVYQDGATAAKSIDSSADESTRRQQMQALMTSVHKAVRALLTEAQAKVFDTMRQPGGRGPGGPGGGAPPSGSSGDGPPSQS